MLTGDFTFDPFGNPAPQIYNPYSDPYDSSGNLVGRTPFQCDGAGNPLPTAADGTQASGVVCNKIPSTLVSTINQNMAALYPAANLTGNPFFNYANVPVRSLNEGKFDVRLDHNFSSKDSVFARFSYDQAVSYVPGGSPGFAEQGAFASSQTITNHGRNVAISETHIFSDHNINQFNAGFNRIFNHIKSFGDRSCESAKLGIPGANLNSSCPGAPSGLTQSKSDCVSCGLTSTEPGGGFWSLGDRGFAPLAAPTYSPYRTRSIWFEAVTTSASEVVSAPSR